MQAKDVVLYFGDLVSYFATNFAFKGANKTATQKFIEHDDAA